MADKISTVYNEAIDEGYTKIKHKSGLDIYIIPKDHSTSFAYFATKYGSCMTKFKLEGEKSFTQIPDGTAHFMEHKMFESEDGEDTFAKYARFGGNANAYTSGDRTAYLFSCTSNEHENLRVLLEQVTKPYFTAENIAKEQGIIGEEIRMYDDDPNWKCYFGALQGMYKSNPVRIDTAGTEESIGTLNPEILYKCYNTFYDVSNMCLILCGKFDKDKVIALADEIIPKSKKPVVELAPYTEPVKANRKKTETSLDVARPLFMIGIKDSNPDNTGKAALKKEVTTAILEECLFGIGSEFYCKNYASGLIGDSFSAEFETSYSFSHLIINGDSDNPDAVLKAVKELMAKTAQKGVSKADFERCKRVVYAKSIVAYENTESAASCMLNAVLTGYDMLDIPKAVFAVKLADVNARAKELFVEDAVSMSVVKPINKQR